MQVLNQWNRWRWLGIAILTISTVTTTTARPPLVDDPTGRDPQRDRWENNWNSDTAPMLAPDVTIDANFVCPLRGQCPQGDQDFYGLMVKSGLCYTVETDHLATGVDTNLIIFDAQGQPLAGNDDRAPGDSRSLVQFCVPVGADGRRTILVGPRVPPPPPLAERTYQLRMTAGPPTVPTPTIVPPTATPRPPTVVARPSVQERPPTIAMPAPSPAPTMAPPTVTATATPTASTVSDSTLTATATVIGSAPVTGVLIEELPPDDPNTTAARVQVELALRIAYDRNQNGTDDVDEGVAGLTVYIADATGTVLGQALSDESGRAKTIVQTTADATLTVTVPYFGAAQTTAANAPQLNKVMIKTLAAVPARIP